MNVTHHQADARLRQAHQDLEELDGQVAEGEIDRTTAETLRAVYRGELEEAETALTMAAGEEEESSGLRLSRRMVVITVAAVLVAGVVFSAGGAVRMRTAGAPITGGFEGVARSGFDQGGEGFDPAAYSDEALEAVVAANTDAPGIAGMRIALADRYFFRGDYQAAFPHYEAVLEADPPPPQTLLATAMSRMGWMAYQGNDQVDLALGLFDRALELRPDDPYITYLKALVLWCGSGDGDQAVELLEEVLDSTEIEEEARATVEADLERVTAGQTCR